MFTEDLHIGGYGKVDMTAQGENCLYATDYTSLNGGEMTFRASERALRAKRWNIDRDYHIYLSEDAETPAPSYDLCTHSGRLSAGNQQIKKAKEPGNRFFCFCKLQTGIDFRLNNCYAENILKSVWGNFV